MSIYTHYHSDFTRKNLARYLYPINTRLKTALNVRLYVWWKVAAAVESLRSAELFYVT